MTLKHVVSGLLLASVAGFAFVSMPQSAQADPPGLNRGPGSCPPGLAKKNPACMPPGQYKKYYRGDYIPDFRSYDRLRYREYGLPYPGDDRRYIRIGNDAYLIAEATQRVIEVINLLNR